MRPDTFPVQNPAAGQASSEPLAAPVLAAYAEPDDGLVWVWCDHELVWHRHRRPCSCPGFIDASTWDGHCRCVGGGDRHLAAHCRCAQSPYLQTGYVLREVGELTWDVLQAHPTEVDGVFGCQDGSYPNYAGSCRVGRAERARLLRTPTQLAEPEDPHTVAHQIAKAYTALEYAEVGPDWEARWAELWADPVSSWPAPEDCVAVAQRPDWQPYDPEIYGPLTLLRWRGAWMRWSGTRWAELPEDELRAELWPVLADATYAKRFKDVVRQVPWQPNVQRNAAVRSALESVAMVSAETEAGTWLADRRGPTTLVSCDNGLLDVATRELIPHDPRWFNLVSVPFPYEATASPPARWLGFLAELWPDDPASVASLQEWFGYVLSGRTDLQKMLLLVGPPRSGKGTIVRILQELVGKANVAGPTLAGLGTNFGLEPLIGKPLAVIADARLGRDTNMVVERLLSISGEDSHSIDRKYRTAWTGRLPTRLMILSNELPHFGDASGAIVTRFVALTMQRSFLGREDTGLERALKAEASGILAWALDGLERLTRQGRITEPSSSLESLEELSDSASPTGAFVRDRCELGPQHSVTAAQLFAAWQGWCYENGREHPGSQQTLGRALRAVVPSLHLARPRDSATGQQVRTYQGIGLVSRAESRQFALSAQALPIHGSEGGLEG